MKKMLSSVAVLLLALLSGTMAGAPVSPAVVRSEFVNAGASYPQCHAATLAETTKGELVAAWFGGTHERHPDVAIWFSRWENGAWTPGVSVADGVQPAKADGAVVRLPTWNPVLFQPRDGPLMLFYKVGPSPSEWWGMMTTSADGGRTWSAARRLPDGVLGPIKNKPVELADGTILSPSSTEGEAGWQLHLEASADLGRNWRMIGPLNTKKEFNAIQPSLLTHADGRLQLLARTKEMTVVTAWSSDQGHTWSQLASTGLAMPNSGLDAVTLADGRQLLVYNWRAGPKAAPASTAEASPADSKAARDPFNVRWPLNVSVSRDGVHWDMRVTLEDEPTPAGYAYPAVIQTRDGLVHIAYTFNREKIKHVVLDPAKL